MAKLDPLWAILSDPQKKFGKWDPQEFFATGDREAERVLSICKSNRIVPGNGKMLDFGCGVGRMTRAFSRFFTGCIGIDVSEKMVELAKKFNADRPHCEFIISTAPKLPFSDKTFDFVFSVLVLQHLSRRDMILGYVKEFVRVAKDEGIVVFQLPTEIPLRQRIQGRRRLWSMLSSFGFSDGLLFQTLGLAPIPMNGISREKIKKFLDAQGAKVNAVERYDLDDREYEGYYYVVSKERSFTVGAGKGS